MNDISILQCKKKRIFALQYSCHSLIFFVLIFSQKNMQMRGNQLISPLWSLKIPRVSHTKCLRETNLFSFFFSATLYVLHFMLFFPSPHELVRWSLCCLLLLCWCLLYYWSVVSYLLDLFLYCALCCLVEE